MLVNLSQKYPGSLFGELTHLASTEREIENYWRFSNHWDIEVSEREGEREREEEGKEREREISKVSGHYIKGEGWFKETWTKESKES